VKLRQTLIVSASGTIKGAVPYEMTVRLTEHYCIIDGIKLSWNDARAAFDMSVSYAKYRKALFGKGH
jgi:hypothetical protein